jgi:hypothetical protein
MCGVRRKGCGAFLAAPRIAGEVGLDLCRFQPVSGFRSHLAMADSRQPLQRVLIRVLFGKMLAPIFW